MVIFMEQKIIDRLIKLLNKANNSDEVPVSALIIKNDKIISTAYNKREKNNNVLGHAEILCINKASKKLHTWKLDDCILYVTLKPCSMCESIIKESRIKEVKYIIDKSDEKKEYNRTKTNKITNLEAETQIKNIMNNFFKRKR